MNPQWDVVVVGGGPAGASASRELASRGFRTLILEAKSVPGVPVRCGELMRPASLLSREAVSQAHATQTNCITDCVIQGPNGRTLSFRTPDGAFVIRRDLFDAALLAIAATAGAEIRLGRHVVHVAPDGAIVQVVAAAAGILETVTARHVIAADGVGGRVARLCGVLKAVRPGRLCTTATTRIHLCEQSTTAEIQLDPAVAPGGYAWAFPIGDGVWNVGVGVNPRQSGAISAGHYLRRFVERRFPHIVPGAAIYGAIPTANGVPPSLVKNGCTAVGDACRVVNPVTGAGICMAVNTGAEAGRALFRDDGYRDRMASILSASLASSMQVRARLDAATSDQLSEAISSADRKLRTPVSVAAAFASIAQELPS